MPSSAPPAAIKLPPPSARVPLKRERTSAALSPRIGPLSWRPHAAPHLRTALPPADPPVHGSTPPVRDRSDPARIRGRLERRAIRGRDRGEDRRRVSTPRRTLVRRDARR